MAKSEIAKKKCDPNTDDECFLRLLGDYLKFLRINAGFPTPESFANVIDMTRSQYSAYEAGKNLNLITFKKLLIHFNIKVEDWLNLGILTATKDDLKNIETLKQARIQQVIEEVIRIKPEVTINEINSKKAKRYVDILLFCLTPKSRTEILTGLLKMDDTTNTFKRVAGKILDYGWLAHTDKESKNSPQQRYLTTIAGKKILKLDNQADPVNNKKP